jgi:SH3-like domain-containing protein
MSLYMFKMKKFKLLIAGILMLCGHMQIANAAEYFNQTGLLLPRFASLRTNEVNVRTGPGVKYPLEWIFVKRDLPVKIIAEFEHWRMIKDWQGNEGWVHKVMLSGHQTVMVMDEKVEIHAKPKLGSKILAVAEKNVIADFKSCQGEWCQIRVHNFKGWVSKSSLWGV